MNTLEDVPFQSLLGPLEEEVQVVTAPDITVPDCPQILRETEVSFLFLMSFWDLFFGGVMSHSIAFRSHRFFAIAAK